MESEIIPKLPSEIGRECLLRMPFIYHGMLTQVCKSWRAVVKSPLFYQDRKLCVYDPHQHAWRTMGGIPADSTVLAVNQRLISIQEERIMTYDFPSNSWLQIADVPNFRYGSVFPASPEGYIYFAGGDFNTVRTKVFWAS